MEQIRDMVKLRAYAFEKALESYKGQYPQSRFRELLEQRAKGIEAYILGDAKLPESDNSIEMFKDALALINKPTPVSMWQNPNVILPNENQEVLIRLTCGKNRVATYDVQNKEFCVIVQPGYCTIHKLSEVAAWLPIPPYRKEDEQ